MRECESEKPHFILWLFNHKRCRCLLQDAQERVFRMIAF